MKNELMDFTAQANFDFFQYRYMPSEKKKQDFLYDCQSVLKSEQATFLETLKLGWRLAKIKQSGAWKEVINPENGMSFNYSSFEEFSKYAFGFRKTRTSNLLSVAKFVDYDENTNYIVFKNPQYKEMNTSQLIELAPLPEYQREYFTAKIPVKDMRVCKKYINEGTFNADRKEADFDLLSNAREWTENQQKKKDEETARAVDAELKAATYDETDEDDVEYYPAEYAVPTSELAEDYEENSDVGILEAAMDEETVVQHKFSSRAKVRAFLANFEDWETLPGGKCFAELKRYRFKNGVELFAAKGMMCASAANGEEKALLFFFLSLGNGANPIKISKEKLEIWLRAHEGELL